MNYIKIFNYKLSKALNNMNKIFCNIEHIDPHSNGLLFQPIFGDVKSTVDYSPE